MSEYQPALDQLRERRKGKPGELMLWTGVVAMLLAPAFLVGLHIGDEQNAKLASEGVVSEAVVKAKGVRTETGTGRKGKTTYRTVHSVTVEFDFNAKTRYAEWKRGTAAVRGPLAAITTSSIDVPESYHDALAIGQKTTVVRLPTDYASLTLTDRLDHETSLAYHLQWYLGLGAVFLAGLALTVLGWRKRRAAVAGAGHAL